ncbi:MAG: DNA-3-methyladenine glycosylase 2 family protein [Steroidobacteraceae bacterium]
MSKHLQQHFGRTDAVMAKLVEHAGPFALTLRESGTPFHSLARAIASQQLSGAVAKTILGRFVVLYPGGEYPAPQQLLDTPDDTLRAVGFSWAKIAALKDLAAKTLSGVVPTTAQFAALDDEAIIERLVQVRGIGRWSAQMLLMFHLGREDVLPADDFGVRNGFKLAYGLKGLPQTKALLAWGERWKPYRSAASWYLWRAVDLHREAKLPKFGRAPRMAIAVLKEKPAKKKKNR